MKGTWLDDVLSTASKRYGFQPDKVEKLSGGYENEMYGVRSSKERFVIRITPPGHKRISEIEAEIDFLKFLNEREAPVVEVIRSKADKAVEVVPTTEGEVAVVCFNWADGRVVNRNDFSEDLFQKWGEAVGILHSLTKEYRPKQKGRIEWDADEYLSRNLIPANQLKVLERFDALIDHFRKLPKDRDSFGLIHQDIHHENLFWDGKKLTVLDFDDCVYGFLVFDIANALGFSIWEKPDTLSNQQFAEHYLDCFMKGYGKQNQLDESWRNHLHYALKLFEFIHYNAFNMDYDLAGTGSYENLPVKTKEILKRYRRSIEEDLPYIEHTFCPYK